MDAQKLSNKLALKNLCEPKREKATKHAKLPKKQMKLESRMHIIDDDIGLPAASAVDIDQQEAFYADAEETPTVVGFVDESTGESNRDISKWRQLEGANKPHSSVLQNRRRTDGLLHSSRSDDRKRDSSDSDLSPERPTNDDRANDTSPRQKIFKKEPGASRKLFDGAGTTSVRSQPAGLITNASEFALSKRRTEKLSRTNVDSDKNAETVYRDRDTGRKTDRAKQRAEEAAEQSRKAEERQKLIEKYAQLGRGVRQIENREQSRADTAHEMSKPVARARDDKDLDRMQRDVLHSNDPMLQFQQPRRERKSRFDNAESDVIVKARPVYKGTWPSNRYNLPPGHRWDGVDRSNGFEQKLFKAQANTRATDEQAYKWSTEDM